MTRFSALAERLWRDDLGADVSADSLPTHPPANFVRRDIDGGLRSKLSAKFVFVEARGDMRMAAGQDIGIDANRYGRAACRRVARGAQTSCSKHLQLGFRFHIEKQDA